MRVKYDPRDLSAVFLEDEAGRYWPVRYRDLGRPPITLWEHKAAIKELRARGRSLVDEQSIFEAVAARRAVVAGAAARTAPLRAAGSITATVEIAESDEPAVVPMPTEADRGSVEEWS